jgi:hypothetical protein
MKLGWKWPKIRALSESAIARLQENIWWKCGYYLHSARSTPCRQRLPKEDRDVWYNCTGQSCLYVIYLFFFFFFCLFIYLLIYLFIKSCFTVAQAAEEQVVQSTDVIYFLHIRILFITLLLFYYFKDYLFFC